MVIEFFSLALSPGIAEAAKKKAESLYPGVTVVGCRDGYFKDSDNKSIIDAINNSGAQILFIALGAPKQEKWLQTHLQELKPYITMGIGGSFDVLAREKWERAPLCGKNILWNGFLGSTNNRAVYKNACFT